MLMQILTLNLIKCLYINSKITMKYKTIKYKRLSNKLMVTMTLQALHYNNPPPSSNK